MVKLKKSILLIILSFCLIFLSGCQKEVEDFSDNEETASETTTPTEEPAEEISFIFTQQPSSMAVPLNQSHTLACTAEYSDSKVYYRWFECTDSSGTSKTPISNNWTENSNIEIEAFTAKGIRYFVCCASTYIPQGNEIPANSIYSDIVAVAYTGLPLIKIDTGDTSTSQITRENYVPCSIIITQPDGSENEYQLTEKGIKGRGNASWTYPKKGYNLNFNKKEPFFGLQKSKKWCLVSNYDDPTLMHNSYASFLGNNIFNSGWNPSFVFVDVIINNVYLGNYIFCEKNTIDDGRIEIQDISDVEKNLLLGKTSKITDTNNDNSKDIKDGGFVLEIDFRNDADFYFKTTKGVCFTLKEPDDVSKYSKEIIVEIVQKAEDMLYGDSFTNTAEENGRIISEWMQFIDIDSLIDWYLINEFAKQLDSPFVTSVYLYYNPADSKLHFGPIWDFDHSFGTFHRDPYDLESPEGWFTRRADGHSGLMSVNWIARMAEDSNFTELLKIRWNEKKSDLYTSINTVLENTSDDILLSAESNFLIWKTIAPDPSYKDTYLSYVNNIIQWCNERYAWMDSAINSL